MISFSQFGALTGVSLPVQAIFNAETRNGYVYFFDQDDFFYRMNLTGIESLPTVSIIGSFVAPVGFYAVYDGIGNVQLSFDGVSFDAAQPMTFDSGGIELDFVAWSHNNSVCFATSDGVDTFIYSSANGVDFIYRDTIAGMASSTYLVINGAYVDVGVLYSFPEGVFNGANFYHSNNGYTFLPGVVISENTDINTLASVAVVDNVIYALSFGVGGALSAAGLYQFDGIDSFALNNPDCFGYQSYVPFISNIGGSLFGGLGYTNPPLVAIDSLFVGGSNTQAFSGNQAAVGGGINGAGGAVGFSGVSASLNFSRSGTELLYPSGIAAQGNSFAIDLGL